MKSLMILGSIVGLLIGMGFGLAADSPWPTALWRGCAAALVAALLTRWWSRLWMQGLREVLEQRHRARHAPAAVAKPASNV